MDIIEMLYRQDVIILTQIFHSALMIYMIRLIKTGL